MKTCPICKARCFDDMEVCYGCMHQFGEEHAGELPDGLGLQEEAHVPTTEPIAHEAEQAIAGAEPDETPKERASRPRRKPPLRSAYVFGSSGSPDRAMVDEPAADPSSSDEGPNVAEDAPLAKREPGRTAGHARGIALAGTASLPLREIDEDAVSQLMTSAIRNGRRLIICIE